MHCGLMFIANPPDDLGRYYTSDYHGLPLEVDDLAPRVPRERFKIEFVQKFVPRGRLLEIGPSRGVFCLLAQQAGYDVSAIEMDSDCVRFLNEKLKVRTVHSADPKTVMASESRTYDAVCLWQAIEHLPKPWEVLAEAVRHLAIGGVLVVAAPNPDAWQARLLGGGWPHHDLPRHLFALPIPWLVKFGKEHGLEAVLTTTADPSSLENARFTWHMLLHRLFLYRSLHEIPKRIAMRIADVLAPIEAVEGRGATYTVILRKASA